MYQILPILLYITVIKLVSNINYVLIGSSNQSIFLAKILQEYVFMYQYT
jgi:hypothetical protein